jgi:hypothetical protein
MLFFYPLLTGIVTEVIAPNPTAANNNFKQLDGVESQSFMLFTHDFLARGRGLFGSPLFYATSNDLHKI